jgi:hypothetical protein
MSLLVPGRAEIQALLWSELTLCQRLLKANMPPAMA